SLRASWSGPPPFCVGLRTGLARSGYDSKTGYLPPEHYVAHAFREGLIEACGAGALANLGAPAPGRGPSSIFQNPDMTPRDQTAWLGMSDSNSETSSQIIPLKARADFPIRAEFRPWRALAFELQPLLARGRGVGLGATAGRRGRPFSPTPGSLVMS